MALSLALLHAASPTGSLTGLVKDSSGARIPATSLKLSNRANGLTRTAIASGEGSFSFPLLPPGEWILTVQAKGFGPVQTDPIRIDVDQIARVEILLPVAGSRDSAEVRDAPTPLTGAVISREWIAESPLNGRQYLDLAMLAPGVVPAAPGVQGLGFNFAGSRSQSNVYLLDGVSNQDTQNHGALNGFRISEAIEEFSVQTSPPLPEFGRGSGAQVNAVTRSGSNNLHGSLFEYFRNTKLAAADFFTNKLGGRKAPLNRNQFGGSLGGPILKNRTFFFGTYEGFRQASRAASSTRVPSLAERASVTDPIALRLLEFWPLPNAGSTGGNVNFVADARNRDNDNTGFLRIDHRAGPGQFALRWIEFRGTSVVAGPTPLTGGNSGDPVQRSGMLRYLHAFTPQLLLETTAGFSSNLQERNVQDASTIASELIPVPGVPQGPRGLPFITVTGGYASLGSGQNFPQGRYTSTAEFAANLSWKGMRWGAHIRREGLRQYLDRSSRGVLSFASFANFARGLINSSSFRTGSTLAHWRRTPYALYWQDRVRLGHALTLDFGLRYESGSPSAERDGRAVNFIPGVGPVQVNSSRLLRIDPAISGAAALQFTDGPVSLSATGVREDRNNFAPMAGLAWTPASNWVIRAGYRLAYDEAFGNLLTSMALAPPFSLQTTQTANVTQPGQFGWAQAFQQNVPLISNFGRQGPGTPTVGVIALQGIDPALRAPYVAHYSLAIQRTLGRFLMTAAYQGSAGRKLGIYIDQNQPRVIVRDPTRRGPVAPNEQIFPYPQWGQAQIVKSIGNSNYNGLVATIRGNKLWRGAGFFELSWTHAKSLDYNSSLFGTGNLPGETGAPPDGTNLRLEHGPSSFDVRNRFTAVWGAAWRGWTLQGMAVAQSGSPFTVVSGNPDSNGFNQSTAGVSPNGGNRPDLIGSGPVARDDRNPDAAFDISRFAPALAGRVGTSGRNQYYGPGLQNFDVSLSRQWRLSEQWRLRLSGDFFNVLNRTNFANPVADLSNANFGRIIQTAGSAVSNAVGVGGGATGGPRVVQVSLRLQF